MSIEALLSQHVVLATTLAVLLHQIGLPLPSIPVLIWAGAITSNQPLLAGATFVLSTLAGTAGDLPWYWAGHRYGYRILRLVCRITISQDACVRQTESAFEKRGPAMLVSGAFLPGLGSIAASMAGALHLPMRSFILYDTVGSALRSAAGLALGFVFHHQIEWLLARLADLGAKATLVVVGLFVAYIAYRFVQRWLFLRSLRAARVSVHELHDMMEHGADPVVLDVRTEAHRRLDGRQIPGARSVNLEDLATTLDAVSREHEVVVYCACPNEASAAKVALQLRAHGFRRVRPLAGGIDAWASAGMTVEHYDADLPTIQRVPS